MTTVARAARTLLPWAALAVSYLYRRTWGACECDALRRRLVAEQREKQRWEGIARELYFSSPRRAPG